VIRLKAGDFCKLAIPAGNQQPRVARAERNFPLGLIAWRSRSPTACALFAVTAIHDGTMRQQSTAQLQIILNGVTWFNAVEGSSTFNAGALRE